MQDTALMTLASDYYWRHVKDPDERGCVEWIGLFQKSKRSKPQMFMKFQFENKIIRIQTKRFAYFLANRKYPVHFVRATCGNERCVNQNHLSDGWKINADCPPYLDTIELKRRFDNVPKRKEKDCIIWGGASRATNKMRYGYIKLKLPDGVKTTLSAHRIAIFLQENIWPKHNEMVCHHCDVTMCVNPNHLYIGNSFTNMRDASKRGRRNSHQMARTRRENGTYPSKKGILSAEKKRKITGDRLNLLLKLYKDTARSNGGHTGGPSRLSPYRHSMRSLAKIFDVSMSTIMTTVDRALLEKEKN